MNFPSLPGGIGQKLILRTAFSPPVTINLAATSPEGQRGGDSQGGAATAVMNALKPSIEEPATGLRIEPWGSPGDWRIPLGILLALAAFGVYALARG